MGPSPVKATHSRTPGCPPMGTAPGLAGGHPPPGAGPVPPATEKGRATLSPAGKGNRLSSLTAGALPSEEGEASRDYLREFASGWYPQPDPGVLRDLEGDPIPPGSYSRAGRDSIPGGSRGLQRLGCPGGPPPYRRIWSLSWVRGSRISSPSGRRFPSRTRSPMWRWGVSGWRPWRQSSAAVPVSW